MLLSAHVKIVSVSRMRDFMIKFWRAEGFGCMWLMFDLGICLIFTLEYIKTILSGQKLKTYIFVKRSFSLEFV